ncbi:MAG: SoxY-related AACIE arm protein [Alphaproteobacteria bacterium]
MNDDRAKPMTLSRRAFLATSAAGLVAPIVLLRPAAATPEAMAAAMRDITGGAPVRSGKLKLELPVVAENGNSMPLSVSVDSPMTAAAHVVSIHVLAPLNPQPNVGSFYLGPRAGKARVATRIRLANTQKVTAVAALNDGTWWQATAEVVITLAACLED